MTDGIEPSNGQHDQRGRFVRGNQCGRGNPLAGRSAKFRAKLLQCVTNDDLCDVVAALKSKAKAGDVAAIKELLDRLLGKAAIQDETSGQGGCSKIVFQVLAPDFTGD